MKVYALSMCMNFIKVQRLRPEVGSYIYIMGDGSSDTSFLNRSRRSQKMGASPMVKSMKSQHGRVKLSWGNN